MIYPNVRRHASFFIFPCLIIGLLLSITSFCARADTTTPVIFIHGRNAPPGVWDTMIAQLESQGFSADRLFAWDYDTSASTNEVVAGQFADFVKEVLLRTGAAQVNIVTHSLGSLSTRWYVKFGGGTRTVRNWISLAGPNHGTVLAWACALWDQGCRDMTPGSYVLSQLDANGVEIIPPVRFWTFWSNCDEQIDPPSSTPLNGATNTQEVLCLKHNDQLTNPTIETYVRSILQNDRMPP
ncbi:esterase/lipase family protein [Burkholderia cenocepacia]|uniref:esterase/lipase family protein n=1 Tax=Burkholderia cenocepacia TaxID=95486 RepID=UPI000F592C60|nr:triacylglycerol lipase [Burkholderia cenocepacia]RQU48899.1 triacylglycerol lipase [Burkholderia cenocepacia]RQV31822.1 triacylglycerol lipase [Burkholderia cenocepacia]